jgi:hypothetical protein
MGTDYRFEGGILIDPPLNFAQYKQLMQDAADMVLGRFGDKPPRWMKWKQGDNPLDFPIKDHMPLIPIVEEHTQETDEGVLIAKRVPGLKPAHLEGALGYNMADQVGRLLKLFPKNQFHGEVVALHEEGHSAIKLVINNRTAEEVEGTTFIHFKDGTQQPVAEFL